MSYLKSTRQNDIPARPCTVKTNALKISGKVIFLSVELIFRRQKFTVLASYLSHCKILKYQAITP